MNADPAAPLLAGRYRVIRRLGTGGAATVLLAEDERLGRRVAVKRMHADSPGDSARRFEREARLGASLNHPNVVAVFDTVTDDTGVLIVTEYVEGTTLAAALKQGPLSPQRMLSVVDGLAGALDHAHRQGIVHRDVKPANALLRPDGVVKLADLGIATAIEAASITLTGAMLGTPAYMAPEQLTGGSISAATDVYGLAALAYEGLSGRPAWSGRTAMEVIHKVATRPPPNIRTVWPSAPIAVADVLRRAMAGDPSARPATAGALAAELREALEEGSDGGASPAPRAGGASEPALGSVRAASAAPAASPATPVAPSAISGPAARDASLPGPVAPAATTGPTAARAASPSSPAAPSATTGPTAARAASPSSPAAPSATTGPTAARAASPSSPADAAPTVTSPAARVAAPAAPSNVDPIAGTGPGVPADALPKASDGAPTLAASPAPRPGTSAERAITPREPASSRDRRPQASADPAGPAASARRRVSRGAWAALGALALALAAALAVLSYGSGSPDRTASRDAQSGQAARDGAGGSGADRSGEAAQPGTDGESADKSAAGAQDSADRAAGGGADGNGARTSETGDTGGADERSAGATKRSRVPARSASGPAATPDAAVRGFYGRAAADDFEEAWALAGPGFRQQLGGYASFRGTLSTLERLRFTRLETMEQGDRQATLALATVATHTDRVERCNGTASAVRGAQGWQVDGAQIACRVQ